MAQKSGRLLLMRIFLHTAAQRPVDELVWLRGSRVSRRIAPKQKLFTVRKPTCRLLRAALVRQCRRLRPSLARALRATAAHSRGTGLLSVNSPTDGKREYDHRIRFIHPSPQGSTVASASFAERHRQLMRMTSMIAELCSITCVRWTVLW